MRQTPLTPITWDTSQIGHPTGEPLVEKEDEENPFNDEESERDEEYKDAEKTSSEDWAIHVFQALTQAIDSLTHAFRGSGKSTP